MESIPQERTDKMDFKECAESILECIGGGENISSAAHCATRLRLVIKDNGKVNKSKLENVEGVKGVFEASGQLQIIIGTGTVNKVYAELLEEGNITSSSTEEVKADVAKKQNVFFRIIKALGDVFVPIIPAIVACGILMGLLEGLAQIGPLKEFCANNNFYRMLHYISNAAFACLPILIAVSASKVFKCNMLLAAVLGIIMVHPSLPNAWDAADFVDSDILYQIGDFKVYLQGFQGHVIPVIIAVWIMSKLEAKLHKIVPSMIDLFVTPLCTLLITACATFLFIGPVFSAIENGVLTAAEWFITLPFGIGGFIIGGLYAFTVICGVHHLYNTVEAGLLSSTGFNPWMPIATCVNTAQGAAALAVGLKTKNKKLKSIAIPASLSAYLGITEPAIFGLNLRFRKPLIAGCIGGAVGGWFVSLVGVTANAYGVTGVFGLLITMFKWENLVLYILGIVIASAVAFVISFILFHDQVELDTNEIANPLNGKSMKLQEVKDDTFANEVLGKGYAIYPSYNLITGKSKVYAPFDGVVESVFSTSHAIGLRSVNGVEVLIHIGLNTVELNGMYFKALVEEGAEIRRGDPLIEFEARNIKKAGYDLTTPVIITNSGDYKEIEILSKKGTHVQEKGLLCLK